MVLESREMKLHILFESGISKVFEDEIVRYVNEEMQHITESLGNGNLFNLTNSLLVKERGYFEGLGVGYIPTSPR